MNMDVAPVSDACCPSFAPLPLQCGVNCFTADLCKELNYLQQRYKCAITKRQRIWHLAMPRFITPKRVEPCPCPFKKPIQIIRKEDKIHTRTEQLAYPPVRRLLPLMKDVSNLFPIKRKQIVNRLIRKSLLSMYSRLNNVQPPVKVIPVHKWSKVEWKKHMKYIKKLAKAKQPPKVPKIPRNWKALREMKRYKKLAKPRRHPYPLKPDWKFTLYMKNYKPTDRILILSKPAPRGDDEARFNTLPIKVSPNALLYKISPRMKELATANVHAKKDSDLKENPFWISRFALKAKPSKRTKELAEPKEFENKHIRENPNAISPAALKAKASPRTIELAKPKGT